VRVGSQISHRFRGNSEAHRVLADLFERAGDHKRALDETRLAALAEPTDPSYRIALGEHYFALGQRSKAIETWHQILKIEQDPVRAQSLLGSVYLDHDMPREANEAFARAVQLDPSNPERHRDYARSLERTGRPAEAIVEWQLVAELAKNDHE